ncbi:MAG: dihydrolipoyl dehydrogenase [Deltaproteobacteria bacterium]|nr:dihydrolipoyl dehydrogenase [Deltaproteobacteria bacterium]
MNYDVIIIGGGPGGYVAAERAGSKGKRVCLIERENLGGTCLNWGCIPTKTYLASSKLFYQALHSEEFGVLAKDVRFDFAKLYARKEKIVSTLRSGIVGLMKKYNVEVINGSAELKSKNEVSVDNRILTAENIIIATGASPIIPPIKGANLAHVYDSQKLLARQETAKQICIIGGGIIGMEFACFYAQLGIEVSVVELLGEICFGLDAELSKGLRSEMEKKSIKFYLSHKVDEITESSVIAISPENEKREIAADIVLLSAGRKPNLEGLGLDSVGIIYDKKCIQVDDSMRTNIPNIYAVGDCTGRLQLAHVASRQGEVAVNNICGEQDSMRYAAIPAVVYTSPEVASIGLTEDDAKKANIPVKVNKLPLGVSGRFVAENDKARGLVKVVVHSGTNSLLGVHIIGNLSSEIIWGVAALIEAEFRIEEIRELVFPHPTVGEVIKDALYHL